MTITTNGGINQPYTFTSREYDSEMSMYFYRARYYDSRVGRFVTKDPISFAGGDVNLYAYVGNNPILRVDPLGLWGKEVHYAMTLKIAQNLGYGKLAENIATATQLVDDDARAPIVGMNPYSDQSIQNRQHWHFTTGERRLELYNQALKSLDPYDIGEVLHAIQDSFSHAEKDYETGHGPFADDPNWNTYSYEETYRTTEYFLRNMKIILERKNKCSIK